MLNKPTTNEKIKVRQSVRTPREDSLGEHRLIRTGFLALFVSFCLLAGVCSPVFANGCVPTCSGYTYWEQIYSCDVTPWPYCMCEQMVLETLNWKTTGNCCSGICRVKSVTTGVVGQIYECYGGLPNCSPGVCPTSLYEEVEGNVPAEFGCTCCDPPCHADYCEECVDCVCKVCGDDPKKCCKNGECKQCCYTWNKFACEVHNYGCGCDPIGTSTCTDSDPKEWTIGTLNDCSSECTGGPPCSDYTYINIPCYATQSCIEGSWSYDSTCIAPPEDCTPTYLGICQHCQGGGPATVVKGPDCQCN